MDPRARREELRQHLIQARVALDSGDRASARAHVAAALAIDPQFLAALALKERIDEDPSAEFGRPGGSAILAAPDRPSGQTRPYESVADQRFQAHRRSETGSPSERSETRSPASEVGNPQFQSASWARFEQRTRMRRIEKRAAHARVHIARHRLADAAMIVNEIREIDPEHPELISLSIELDAASHARGSMRRVGPAAAALLVFAASVFGARWLDIPDVVRDTVPRAMSDLGFGGSLPTPTSGEPVLIASDVPAYSSPESLATDDRPVLIQVWPPDATSPGDAALQASAPGVAATRPSSAAADRAADTPPPAPSAAPPLPAPAPPAAPLPAPPPSSAAGSAEPGVGSPVPTAVPQADLDAPGVPATSVAKDGRTADKDGPTADAGGSRAVSPSNERPDGSAHNDISRDARFAAATQPSLQGAFQPSAQQPAVAFASASPVVSPVASLPVADEDLVRRLLQQYRRAYEDLNASSARAVWPGVNESALQRAFDGLETQRLTFADCQVQLRGGTGSAVCRGSARYVPKVGSREPRDERRVWTFTVRKSGEAWQIVNARTEQ